MPPANIRPLTGAGHYPQNEERGNHENQDRKERAAAFPEDATESPGTRRRLFGFGCPGSGTLSGRFLIVVDLNALADVQDRILHATTRLLLSAQEP